MRTSIDDENAKKLISEYTNVEEPNMDKLRDAVIRAKGPKRSMRQFAIDCDVSPSTLSRLMSAPAVDEAMGATTGVAVAGAGAATAVAGATATATAASVAAGAGVAGVAGAAMGALTAKALAARAVSLTSGAKEKKTNIPSDYLLYRIAKNADENSGITFDYLMRAKGKRKITRIDYKENKTEIASRILVTNILNHDSMILLTNTKKKFDGSELSLNEPNLQLITSDVSNTKMEKKEVKSIEDFSTWAFYFYFLSESEDLEQYVSHIESQMVLYWGTCYMGIHQWDKVSFVTDSEKGYKMLTDHIKQKYGNRKAKDDLTSIILIDFSTREVIKEYDI